MLVTPKSFLGCQNLLTSGPMSRSRQNKVQLEKKKKQNTGLAYSIGLEVSVQLFLSS